jgi:GTPase KRas protein
VVDQQLCKLEVLDTAGQEYRELMERWIRDGEGFVLVYSITSRTSFNGITEIHRQIKRVKEESADSSFPVLNKSMPSLSFRGISNQKTSWGIGKHRNQANEH